MGDVFLTGADLSHDAARLAYTTRTVGNGEDHRQLWLMSVDEDDPGPAAVELPGPIDGLAWSPTEHVLAVVAPIGGVRQVVLVRPDGSWRPVTDAARGVATGPVWSPDGTELAAAFLHDEPATVDRALVAIDGLGAVADHAADVNIIDVTTSAAVAVTDGPTADRCLGFDPAGDGVFVARSFEPETTLTTERSLRVARNGTVGDLGWTASATSTVVATTDGRLVLAATRQADRARGVPASLFVRTPDGTMVDRTSDLDLHLLLSTLGDQPSTIEDPRRFVGVHGDDAIAGILRGGAAEVVRIPLAGPVEATTVLDGDRGCHPLALRGHLLLFAASTMDRPPTLRLLDLATGRERTVVDPNPAPARPTVAVRPIDVVSNGDPIQAWFLRSADRPDGPLPTVLIVHGGPYEAFGHTYHAEAQLLADAGYGVAMANPHGSIGYGARFATSIVGRPGLQEMDDLLAVLDRAVEDGLADPDRLAVCGLSYGGYLSALLVAHTNRFRAAAIENPMIDLRSFRDTSDIGADLLDELLGAEPDAAPDRWRQCSPLARAADCTTPSLLVLGEDDLRCPPSEGVQFHEALVASGCPTDLVWLPGAAHADSVIGPADVRRAQDRALLDWFRRYNPV